MSITEDDLRRMNEKLAELLRKGKSEEAVGLLIESLGRLISYIISEKRVDEIAIQKMSALHDSLELHSKALFGDQLNIEEKPGLMMQVLELRRFMEGNRRMHWAVIAAITPLLVKAGWEVLTKHPIP